MHPGGTTSKESFVRIPSPLQAVGVFISHKILAPIVVLVIALLLKSATSSNYYVVI